VNHPWYPGYGYFRNAVLDERRGTHWRKQFSFDFDLIEVVNGNELGRVDVLAKNLPRYYDLLNLGARRYPAVGSSDSHKLTNEWAGYPRTYVRVGGDEGAHVTATELAASLRGGHTVVSLGPFIDARIGDAGPGDTVETVSGSVPLDVTIRAADWMDVSRVDVVLDGDTIQSFDVGLPPEGDVRWSKTLDVPVTSTSWIVVVVRGQHPIDEVLPGLHVAPFAFTSPIWVNALGARGEPNHVKSAGRGSRGARSSVLAERAAPFEAPEPSVEPDAAAASDGSIQRDPGIK
jgi:hypothetical protein